MNFLEKSILKLNEKRKIFHSEDDLKLSLSLIIKELFPEFKIRLEKPTQINMINLFGEEKIVRAPIDIIVFDKDENVIPIELKYKTKILETKSNGELYNLTNHGATDIGRYSFRKDIYRIEQYISNKENNSKIGFVFILTNDYNYINNNINLKDNFDKHFSCHQDNIIKKEFRGWNYSKIDTKKYIYENNIWKYRNSNKKHWTFSNDKSYVLNLKNNYYVNWKEYSRFNDSSFKYSLFEIKKEA